MGAETKKNRSRNHDTETHTNLVGYSYSIGEAPEKRWDWRRYTMVVAVVAAAGEVRAVQNVVGYCIGSYIA